jgi:hypothetical protein
MEEKTWEKHGLVTDSHNNLGKPSTRIFLGKTWENT